MITDMTRSLKVVDVKIDILDDYIRTLEVFGVVSEKNRSTGGLPEPPRGVNWASWA